MSPCLDGLAWLALLGLLEPGTVGMERAFPGVPRAACRLAATVPVALAAYLAHAVGLPPAPWPGAIEAMGMSSLGHVGAVVGAGGIAWRLQRWWRGRAKASAATAGEAWWARAAWLPLMAWPYTLMPPWAIDETAYHLALPARARALGHLAAPLGHGNGGFFALADWLGSWGLAMGSLSAARGVQLLLVHLALAAALVLAPQARGRVLAAFAVWLASPVALWQLGTSYVDLAAASYALVAALLLGAHAPVTSSAAEQRDTAEEMGAWLVGAAIATKATTLPLLAVLAWRRPQSQEGFLAGRGRLVALAGLAWLPFCLHNLAHYHSPLFPFSAPLDGGGEQLLPAQWEVLQAFMAHHGPASAEGVPLLGPSRWLALPWALFFQAAFASPQFDGVIGGAPLVGVGLATGCLVQRRNGRQASPPGAAPAPVGDPATASQRHLLLCSAGVLLLAWLATSWQARFLLAPLLLLATWCALALPPCPWRGEALLLAVALAAQVAFWPTLRGHAPPFESRALQGASERAALRRWWSPASALCDGLDPAVDGVMLVWTQRLALWCPAASVADSYDEGAHVDAILSREEFSPAAATASLRALGVTHLLIDERAWLTAPDELPEAESRSLALRTRRWQQWRTTLHRSRSAGPIVLFSLL